MAKEPNFQFTTSGLLMSSVLAKETNQKFYEKLDKMFNSSKWQDRISLITSLHLQSFIFEDLNIPSSAAHFIVNKSWDGDSNLLSESINGSRVGIMPRC